MLTVQQLWTSNNANTWRFIATPLTDAAIQAEAGHVLDITLDVDPYIAAGVYTARLEIWQEESDNSATVHSVRTRKGPD